MNTKDRITMNKVKALLIISLLIVLALRSCASHKQTLVYACSTNSAADWGRF